jgi:cytochrome c
MRRSRRLILGCVAAAWASLMLGRLHPFGDAGLAGGASDVQAGSIGAQGRAPILGHDPAPAEVRDLLMEKCADCHSTETRSHFYGRFAPASWLMERDILAGRQHLNLSAWDSYSPEQREMLKAKMLQQVKAGTMPLPQYLLVHWAAHISDADIKTLQQWAREEALPTGKAMPAAQTIAIASAAGGAGEAARGKDVFEKRCTGCHGMETDREGPRLAGVYGRASGAVTGFGYSEALRKAHLVWNESTLDQWLVDPDKLVPGNDMEFHVAKPDERRDLIRFLKQSAGDTGHTR